MRRFICLLLIVLIFPVVQARNAVFVSKYESRSIPDVNIANYYNATRQIFDINIIPDVKVKDNSTDWINAYTNADLIFVISLNDEMLKESRSIFCGNLSTVLNKMKGIVFAGSSNIFNESTFGCPYTPYFDLASAAKNVELKSNSVKLNETHQITVGYATNKTYNIKVNDSFYPIVSPKNGTIIGTVYGDPDGSGPLTEGNYPFLVVWEGIDHRIAVWTMNTSELTDCSDCLGWNLFNQLLNWVSNTSDMGFKIMTDKEMYYPEETIKIYVKSSVDINKVNGTINYPDGKKYALSFRGSGKEWESSYILEREDPSGNYAIEVIADEVKKSKTISVNAFRLNLDINNQTEKVKIWVNATDLTGNIVNVNLTINITSPKGEKTNYYFENNGSVLFIYGANESGEYKVQAYAIDAYGRSDSKTQYFTFYFKPSIVFTPENITRVVQEAGNITESITVFNNASVKVSNTQIKRRGEIKDWITLTNTSLGEIEPNESKELTFKISVPEVGEGNYSGELIFVFDGDEYPIPITIKMKFSGILSVTPESWRGWIIKGQSKTVQFSLLNSGKGDVLIKSVDVTGDLEDKISVVQKPEKVEPGANKSLKIEIRTSDIILEGLTKRFSNQLTITTDQGPFLSIPLEINVVENIREMALSLSLELDTLEGNLTSLKKVLDVSSLEEKLKEIRNDLDEIKSSFDQGNYEDAASLYESLEMKVESLKTDVERASMEAKEKRKPNMLIIVALVVSVALVTIILLIWKRIQSEKKYAWLYEKWKTRIKR